MYHIVSTKVYLLIFAALRLNGADCDHRLGCFIDLGFLNDVVAMATACTKATLVILYFMHVRYSSKLTWAFVAAGFVFLLILLAFILSDVMTRDWIGPPASWGSETGALDPR